MFNHYFDAGDALGQLIRFAVISAIYSIIVVFITIFMKMKDKDRLIIFISSFITMMDICLFEHSMSYVHNRNLYTYFVPLLLPILADGLIYKNTLTYKKIDGFLIALIIQVSIIVLGYGFFIFLYMLHWIGFNGIYNKMF